jgi:hypothetical protein
LEASRKLGGVGGKEKKPLCFHQAHDWEILMDLSRLKGLIIIIAKVSFKDFVMYSMWPSFRK